MTGHGVEDVNLRIFSSYIRIVNLLMIRLGRWISIPEVLLHIDQRIANIHAMTVLHTCSVLLMIRLGMLDLFLVAI